MATGCRLSRCSRVNRTARRERSRARRAMLRAVKRALEDGVDSVNLVTPREVYEELFSYVGCGTLFTQAQYGSARPISIDDFEEVEALIVRGQNEGVLLPRKHEEIAAILPSCFGYRIGDEHLAGICSLLTEPYRRERAGELTALYTLTRFQGEGVAAELTKELLKEAAARKLRYVFACTSEERAARFFKRLHFRRVGPQEVPPAKWHGYDRVESRGSPFFASISARAARSVKRIPTRTRGYVAVAGLALLTLVLTLHRLGAADVCGANEAIEGLFVQQMVEHGALLFPVANGGDPMYKPPLFHWTATGLAHLFGVRTVTAFSLRAPSALYASAGVALTVGFALSWLDLQSAVLAGLVLLSSYQYVSEGRIGRVDMALTFFEALALFSFMWWLPRKELANTGTPVERARDNQTALRYLFAAAIGLAVLAKGPVGAILPLLRDRRLHHLGKALAGGTPTVLARFSDAGVWPRVELVSRLFVRTAFWLSRPPDRERKLRPFLPARWARWRRPTI